MSSFSRRNFFGKILGVVVTPFLFLVHKKSTKAEVLTTERRTFSVEGWNKELEERWFLQYHFGYESSRLLLPHQRKILIDLYKRKRSII